MTGSHIHHRTTHIQVLSKANDVTNNVANITATNNFNKENQEYHRKRDQQYVGRKYDGGLERVTIELVPGIILEEEKQLMKRMQF